MGLSPYWGLSGARNWELIQPFQRVFSTWTQSPSRPVAVNCVPLGAVPRTGAFPVGADLMLTLGRCKKTSSGFCAVDVLWGVTALAATWDEAAAVGKAGTLGEVTTPDAPGDGSDGCTQVLDDDSTPVGEDTIGEDAIGEVADGAFAPDARKKYVSKAAPNAATIAALAISIRRLGSGAGKHPHPQTGPEGAPKARLAGSACPQQARLAGPACPQQSRLRWAGRR
jgi:hypothetical protein